MGMREYETIFILKPELGEDAVEKVMARLDKALEAHKGVTLVKENWGKKKLAYEIARNAKGIFMFYHYLGGGALVSELERNLKIDDSVLRYMTIKVDEDVEAEARLKAISERPKVSHSTLDDDDDMGPGDRRHGRDRGDFHGRGRGSRDDDDREMDYE